MFAYFSSCRRPPQPPSRGGGQVNLAIHTVAQDCVLFCFLFSLLCMFFCRLFVVRFQLGTFPPRGTAGCATFPFRVSFRLSSSRPPATLAVRGRVLTLVSLIIAPAFSLFAFFVSPLRHAGGRWEILKVVCLIIAPAFPFNCHSSCATRKARRRGRGSGGGSRLPLI